MYMMIYSAKIGRGSVTGYVKKSVIRTVSITKMKNQQIESSENMPPLSILIKPASGMCNMRCRYCFYHDVAKNRDISSYGMMSEDTLSILVEKAMEYAEGDCTFAFQGGEPTMRGLDFYQKLMALQKKYYKKGVTVHNSIQTNGYAINEQWAEFFAENKFLVGLSMDGGRELHDSCRIDANGNGTFSTVMKTAELFNRYQVEYNILCVVTNFIARHGHAVYRFFKKNGFRYLQFIQCLDPFEELKGEYSLEAKRYGEFLRSTFDLYYQDFMKDDYVSIRMFDNYLGMLLGNPPESCGMSGICNCYFVVEGDGSVYPCDFYVLDEWKIGNIRENSFPGMLHHENARRFVQSSNYIDPACKSCKWFQLCRGGCRRCREPFVDGHPTLNAFCESYYAFFEYSYKRMLEMARKIRYRKI